MQVFFEQRSEVAPGIWKYTFRPERAIDFVAGQYIQLTLSNISQDPRGGWRTFSITTLPTDTSFSFITKHFTLQSPYKHALQNMGVGDPARISDAMGDLILPKSPTLPLAFVAGGIGIASYASMFGDLLARKEERPIFFYYALRTRREQIFRELTEAYPLQLQSIILSPNHLEASEIKDSTPPNALIYLSGGQQFVEDLRAGLEGLGTPRSQIVFDYYDGYTDL